nr:EOG090X05NI [Artemia franciscana]
MYFVLRSTGNALGNHGKWGGKNPLDLDYADDLSILDESVSKMNEILEVLQVQGARIGLKINVKEIKSLRLGISEDEKVTLEQWSNMASEVMALRKAAEDLLDVFQRNCLRIVLAQERQLSPQTSTYGWRKYWRKLRFIPLSLGLTSIGVVLLVALQQLRRRKKDPLETPDLIAQDWEVKCYRMIPLRALSRAWGWIHAVDLPIWARRPLLSWYCDLFGCNINEAEVEDLRHYKNLGEFFRRGLKDGMRPIAPTNCVVSPADGTVLHYGKVENGYLEQVKGVKYSLSQFLGPQSWSNSSEDSSKSLADYQKSLLKNPNNELYHCVIYLAPGDYHRFHSPTNWRVKFRRHFPGDLLSVSPIVAKWLAGLFCLNERAAYIGEWEHGFFSMAPVGATNVGSIKVNFDSKSKTNTEKHILQNIFTFKTHSNFTDTEEHSIFRIHSTIVEKFEMLKQFLVKLSADTSSLYGLHPKAMVAVYSSFAVALHPKKSEK